MDIGRLRQRVTFYQREDVEDELGQSRQELKKVCNVCATITPTKGGEYYEAQKLREELTWKIFVRYLPNVTADMVIRYKQRWFQIKSVIDMDFKQRTLELICTEYIQKDGEENGGKDTSNRLGGSSEGAFDFSETISG